MATAITEADSFNATMTAPDDGDSCSAASITAAGVGFQVAADRTRYLYNRNLPASGGYINIPLFACYPILAALGAMDWEANMDFVTPLMHWETIAIGATDRLVIPIQQVHNASFDELVVSLHGAFHGAWPVGQMPTMRLMQCTSAGVTTQIGAITDPTVVQATYELPHDVTLSFAAQTFDPDISFYATIEGESAGNAAPGLRVYRLKMQVAPV